MLKSHSGRNFTIVLQGLAEIGYLSAWRILDAQYDGVAQRRQRVFIVGRLRNVARLGQPQSRQDLPRLAGLPAEVLFESQSLSWDSPPRREAGKGVAAPLKASSPSRRAGGSWPIAEEFAVTATLTGRMQGQSNQWPPINEADNLVAYAITTREGQRMEPTQDTFVVHQNFGGSVTPANHARALRGGASHNYQFVLWHNKGQDFNCREYRDISPAVTQRWGTGGGNVPFIGTLDSGEQEEGFRTEPGEHPVAAYNWQSGGDVRLSFGKPNLQANQVPAVGVRRLTPTECERLQGFPDGWTDGQADSTRYRQLGNAVWVNGAQWIGERIAKATFEPA